MRAEFHTITLPVLIMHGTADKATMPAGSKLFYEKAGSRDKTLKLYENHFHDLLNDTGKEQVLAEIWAEVLRVDRVGAHDNFFELGGHSLLATQVVSRVYETFESRLPLRRMFEEPTVAGLATVLSDSGGQRRIERTAELLLKVAQLSDEEAGRLLEEKLCQVSQGERNE